MAKRYTLNEIRAMSNRELNRMDYGQVLQAIRTLNDVVTKRMKRLEASGLFKNSGAYHFLKKKYGENPDFRMGQFDKTNPKDYARAKSMMYDLVGFVDTTRKSATVSGMRLMYQATRERIGWKDATDDEVGEVFKALHELQEEFPAAFGMGDYGASNSDIVEIVHIIRDQKKDKDEAKKIMRWRKGDVDVEDLADYQQWMRDNYKSMLGVDGLDAQFEKSEPIPYKVEWGQLPDSNNPFDGWGG